jgi:beta-mannosidase
MITVYGVNEGQSEWKGALRYGLFATMGGRPLDETWDIVLPANASTPLATIERSKWETLGFTKHGAFAALFDSAGNLHAQHRLFLARFKDLDLAEPGVRVKRLKDSVSYASDVFVWGVVLDIDGESDLADNAFDLIPGLPYRVPLPAGRPAPSVLRTGNDLALRKGK